MTTARGRVTAYWDSHIDAWLAGADPMPDQLARWYAAYGGSGAGKVTRDGFIEPYIGDLANAANSPRVVILGLNPGQYQPHFQSRTGIFAEEIRRHGSYSAWAATGPYLRDPWNATMGPNRYWTARLALTRRWLGDPTASHRDLLIFEAYPWHSTKITASMRPPTEVIDEVVWQPIAELDVPVVFAFGRPWDHLAAILGLPQIDALGVGGRDYGSRSAGRAVRAYQLPSGQVLIIEWHPGNAGPPSETETTLLKHALAPPTPD